MRIVIAGIVLALVAGLAAPADAASKRKKKHHRYAAAQERIPPEGGARDRALWEFGYDATPESHRVGSDGWWRAMDRQGRGGFGTAP